MVRPLVRLPAQWRGGEQCRSFQAVTRHLDVVVNARVFLPYTRRRWNQRHLPKDPISPTQERVSRGVSVSSYLFSPGRHVHVLPTGGSIQVTLLAGNFGRRKGAFGSGFRGQFSRLIPA